MKHCSVHCIYIAFSSYYTGLITVFNMMWNTRVADWTKFISLSLGQLKNSSYRFSVDGSLASRWNVQYVEFYKSSDKKNKCFCELSFVPCPSLGNTNEYSHSISFHYVMSLGTTHNVGYTVLKSDSNIFSLSHSQ